MVAQPLIFRQQPRQLLRLTACSGRFNGQQLLRPITRRGTWLWCFL
jgi:hypothetical protein